MKDDESKNCLRRFIESLSSNMLHEVGNFGRALIYPKDFTPEKEPSLSGLMSGLSYAQAEREESEQVLSKTRYARIVKELLSVEELIRNKAMHILTNRIPPPQSEFNELWQIYEDFMIRLQRIERDLLTTDTARDPLTGLRHKSVMMEDLAKELERRSRRGLPFSLVIMRFNDPRYFVNEEALQMVSQSIQKTIRIFDDGYYCEKGEFLVSLKHADANGALRFVARFNDTLHDFFKADFSLSSVVCEPVPGDQLEDLIHNMHIDIERIISEGGGSSKYQEMSELTRFIKGLPASNSN